MPPFGGRGHWEVAASHLFNLFNFLYSLHLLHSLCSFHL